MSMLSCRLLPRMQLNVFRRTICGVKHRAPVLVEPIMLAVAVVDKDPERHRLVVMREVRTIRGTSSSKTLKSSRVRLLTGEPAASTAVHGIATNST
jgi:hypothetical protein